MADLRSSSYRRLARERFSRSPTRNQKVSINPENVVSGGGQVAISGKGSDNIQYSGGSSTSPAAPVVEDAPVVTQPSQSAVDTFKGTTTVPVSPGVASKLAQQSLRQDSFYSVNVEPRPRQSVDTMARDFVGAKKGYSDLTTREKTTDAIKKAYDESFLSTPEKGIKYLFSTSKNRLPRTPSGELNLYSDNPDTQKEIEQRFARENEGRQAAADLLLMGGTANTFEPVNFGRQSAKVASKTVSKAVSNEAGKTATTSVVSGEGLVERRLLGFKVLPDKKMTFTGRASQVTSETGFVGGVSKEPILKTSSQGKFNVLVGKKKLVMVSESEGFSVAGLGQRKNVVATTTPKGVKTTSVGSSVDTFVSRDVGDVVYGGVVKSDGVEVF